MATNYTVKAPLVIAKNEQGGDVYVYRGAPVPDGQSDEWIKQHRDDDMIVVGDDLPPNDSDADVGARTAPATDSADTASTTVAAGVEKPAHNASASEWRTYAVLQGMSQAEAALLSRDELRDRFKQ